MGMIERFEKRLDRARECMGKRLKSIKGGKKIGEVLGEIKRIEETSDWMPEPKEPGIGVVGEGTRRMSRGGLP